MDGTLNNSMDTLKKLHDSIFIDAADPRMLHLPLLGSPITVICISMIWFVFIVKIGPSYMRHRKAYNLTSLIIAVNGLQVVCNLYLLYEYLTAGWLTTYNLVCEPCDYSNNPEAMRMAKTTYLYLLLKLFDMVDTIIYVLRHKTNQITFLHVYHHLSTLLLAWVIANYAPGGHGTFVQLLNTMVHIIMYFYYFISALGPRFRPYLWWKRYLTRVQLVQFVVQFAYTVNALRIDCNYPRNIIYLFLPIITLMFVLFLNFYVKAYSGRRLEKQKTT